DEMCRRALKIGAVGQHRKAGRTAFGIGAGQGRRIEIRTDEAGARARLLDLGDEGAPPGRDRAGEGGGKAARRRCGGGGGFGGGERPGGFRQSDLGALLGADAFEHVAHAGASEGDGGSLVMATRLSSALRALPSSTACAARATPARRSAARPATISAAAALSS